MFAETWGYYLENVEGLQRTEIESHRRQRQAIAQLTLRIMIKDQSLKNDFFISYNKADSQWAEWVAWILESEGYITILQAWDFRPGQSFVLRMNEALQQCNHTIAILSPNYLEAEYTQPEWAAAFAADPKGEKASLIPVRVRECDLQGLLLPIIHIDLMGLQEQAAKTRLLSGVRGGRAKPKTKPPFPLPHSASVTTRPAFPGHKKKSTTKRLWWLIAIAVPIVLLVLAFSLGSRLTGILNSSPPKDSTDTEGQHSKKYQISASRWVGYAPLYIARSKGWLPHWSIYDRDQMDTKEVIEHIRSKKDFAFVLTFDSFYNDTVSGAEFNLTPTAILVLDQSTGGDAVVAHNSIESYKDLRGKRVGLWPGSSAEIFLADELSAQGVKFNELKQPAIFLSPQELVELFCKEKLDAVALFSPFLERAEECGHTLPSSSRKAPIFDALFLHEGSATQGDREAILELFTAWDKGVHFVREETPESFRELASVMQVSESQARRAYSRVTFFSVDETVTRISDWATLAESARDYSQRAGLWHRGAKSVIRFDQNYVQDYLKSRK